MSIDYRNYSSNPRVIDSVSQSISHNNSPIKHINPFLYNSNTKTIKHEKSNEIEQFEKGNSILTNLIGVTEKYK